MSLTDKFELVRIAEEFGLDLNIGSNNDISVGRWNGQKFEWYILKLKNQPIDWLFEQINKHLEK